MLVQLGVIDWVSLYWLFNISLWIIGLMAVSIHCTTRVNVYGLKIHYWPFKERRDVRHSDIESNTEDDPVHDIEERRLFGDQFIVVDGTFGVL